jgi:uncharacterized protein YkwD
MRPGRIGVRAPLLFEHLEDRTVPTTATLTGSVLNVLGSYGADVIQISQASGVINVSGVATVFDANQVKLISIEAGASDDVVTVSPSVSAPTWVFGNSGNDQIVTGGGNATVYGGGGDDTISGGAGADVLYGGLGTNSVTGQAGDQVWQGTPYAAASLSTMAQDIVRLTNDFRVANGLAPLQVSGQLTAMADVQAKNMVSMVPLVGFDAAMSHVLYGVPQATLASRADYAGYDSSALGENIAYGYGTADAVMQAWINSPGHCANLLNVSFTQMGVSIAYTPEGIPYFAQDFGVPTADNPTGPTPTTTPTSDAIASSTQTVTSQLTDPIVVTQGFGAGSTRQGQIYAVGTVSGVDVYDMATGYRKFQLRPYGTTFKDGIRVAVADMTGDGMQDVVVAPPRGVSPLVRIYDGVSGKLVKSFYAYSIWWTGGVNIAVGDVTGDGRSDIVTGCDAGLPQVRVFNGKTFGAVRSFYAYATTFHGGVRVAAGDVNGDGKADIITAPGAGMPTIVKTFSGATGTMLSSFCPYDSSWTGGAFVAAGDIDGDGRADIVTGADAGAFAHVRAFSGSNNLLLSNFLADSSFNGGVRVAVRDVTGDGKAEIIAGLGRGGDEVNLCNSCGDVLAGFLATVPTIYAGLYVG